MSENLCFFDAMTPNGRAGMVLKIQMDSLEGVINTIQHTASNLMEDVSFVKATVVEGHEESIEDSYVPEAFTGQENEDGSLTLGDKTLWFRHIMTINGVEEEE